MKFMLSIYNDKVLLDALPPGEFDSRMRHCLAHADDLRDQGKLLDAQILAAPSARSPCAFVTAVRRRSTARLRRPKK